MFNERKHPSNCVAIDVEIEGPDLDEKSSYKMLRLLFLFIVDWGSCAMLHLSQLVKLLPRKSGP